MDYELPKTRPPEDYLEIAASSFLKDYPPGSPEWAVSVGYLYLLRESRNRNKEPVAAGEDKSPARVFENTDNCPMKTRLNSQIVFNSKKTSKQKSRSVEIVYRKSNFADVERRRLVPYKAATEDSISGYDLDREALRCFKLENISSMAEL